MCGVCDMARVGVSLSAGCVRAGEFRSVSEGEFACVHVSGAAVAGPGSRVVVGSGGVVAALGGSDVCALAGSFVLSVCGSVGSRIRVESGAVVVVPESEEWLLLLSRLVGDE